MGDADRIADGNKPEAVDDELEKSWMLFERVVRSTAHSVGNAINVVSGRLSLLELDDGLSAPGRESLALIRERLRKTHSELKGAVSFAYGERRVPAAHPVVTHIASMTREFGFTVNGLNSEREGAVPTGHSRVRLDVPLRSLCEACRELGTHSHGVEWTVHAEENDNLVLTLLFEGSHLPADRRLVLEPWFESAAIRLPDNHRYARLLLATALGRLEEGGANVSVSDASGADADSTWTAVRVVWPE